MTGHLVLVMNVYFPRSDSSQEYQTVVLYWILLFSSKIALSIEITLVLCCWVILILNVICDIVGTEF